MKMWIQDTITFVILALLLPFVSTLLIKGNTVTLYEKAQTETEDEAYVEACFSALQLPDGNDEFLKAMAVILRSRLQSDPKILPVYSQIPQAHIRSQQSWLAYAKRMKDAVKETKGEVIVYQNKVIYPPYHLVSASVTRDASDLLDKQNIPYLKSVESMIDQHSEEYCHTFFYSWEEVNKKFDLEFTEGFEYKETLSEQIKIKKSSQKNYVASVEIGEFEVTGDRLRELFDLPSISFELFLSEEGMRIVTYGVGHGLGMSLYGAQQMAEKGMDYQTILKYFYPETEIKVLSE